jgi:adenosylmethionine-8-amino-7-oxononanoate aminotransferase
LVTREQIVAIDRRRVWHPYTPADDWDVAEPLVVTRAAGPRIWDVDGNSYFDGNSSWWVATLGHGHPRLVSALTEQARTLSHVALAGITHEPAAMLADEMIAIAPAGMSRVFFVDDGSTAIESAVKIAAQYFTQNGRPKKRRFVSLEGAFHGDTIGAAALGGVEVFRRPFAGLLFDTIHVEAPWQADAYPRAFDQLSRVVAEGADEIAAVVLEPLVQGAAGMRIYPPEYLSHARALCDRHDVLLILDEVFTGYGRTGRFWASEHAGVSPDLLCTAKGFSGGMLPMGATLVTERIYDGFRGARDRAFYYGHSFCGNPLGAAVAREVLAVYRDEAVLSGVAPRAARIAETFARLGELPGVRDARSLGMVGALDLPSGGEGYLSRAGWRVYDEAKRRGAYLRPMGDVVYVTPPLNIAPADLDELLSIVEESVRAVVLRLFPGLPGRHRQRRAAKEAKNAKRGRLHWAGDSCRRGALPVLASLASWRFAFSFSAAAPTCAAGSRRGCWRSRRRCCAGRPWARGDDRDRRGRPDPAAAGRPGAPALASALRPCGPRGRCASDRDRSRAPSRGSCRPPSRPRSAP